MTMPRLLAISDLHLTDNPADQYRHDFMADLPVLMAKRKPDALLILGDLTEEKDRHPARLVNKIVDEIDALAAVCPVAILMGNHDFRNEGHPFFAFTKRLPNVAWIEKVSIAANLPKEFRSIFAGCLFLPHTRTYERDWAAVPLPYKDFRFVFAHNTFDGSKTPAGHSLEGIPASVFEKGARVVSGDVHTPQDVGCVTYVGAPYTVDFGDDYDPRLLMLEGLAMHPISVRKWPQKRLVVVDDLAELEKVKGLNAGDIVKVRIGVDDMGTWSSTHRDVLEWCARKELRLFRAEPVIERKILRRQHRVRPEDQADDATVLRQYAKRHDIDAKILAEGLELLK